MNLIHNNYLIMEIKNVCLFLQTCVVRWPNSMVYHLLRRQQRRAWEWMTPFTRWCEKFARTKSEGRRIESTKHSAHIADLNVAYFKDPKIHPFNRIPIFSLLHEQPSPFNMQNI